VSAPAPGGIGAGDEAPHLPVQRVVAHVVAPTIVRRRASAASRMYSTISRIAWRCSSRRRRYRNGPPLRAKNPHPLFICKPGTGLREPETNRPKNTCLTQSAVSRTKRDDKIPASCGLFASLRETSANIELCGGPGRSDTTLVPQRLTSRCGRSGPFEIKLPFLLLPAPTLCFGSAPAAGICVRSRHISGPRPTWWSKKPRTAEHREKPCQATFGGRSDGA